MYVCNRISNQKEKKPEMILAGREMKVLEMI